VSTAEALEAVSDMSRLEGIFTCPEAATTLAGLKKAVVSGMVGKGERVVIVNTGSGLKSVPSLPSASFRTIEANQDVSACLGEQPR
jgi:threonine synthase